MPAGLLMITFASIAESQSVSDRTSEFERAYQKFKKNFMGMKRLGD
jgi:hypothetical protein